MHFISLNFVRDENDNIAFFGETYNFTFNTVACSVEIATILTVWVLNSRSLMVTSISWWICHFWKWTSIEFLQISRFKLPAAKIWLDPLICPTGGFANVKHHDSVKSETVCPELNSCSPSALR